VSAGSVPVAVTSALRIGQNMDGGEGFPGVIDDVKIYGRALSAFEILQLYTDSGLVSHWTFNDNVNDVIGGNNGTSNDGNYVAHQALAFNGSSDKVDVPSNSNLGLTKFSVVGWVYLASMPAGWATIMEHNRWGSNWYGLWKSANGNKFHFRWSSDGMADFQSTIVPRVWYHVAGTYSNGKACLYLNGSKDSCVTVGSAPTAAVATSRIGLNLDGGEGFPGNIYDIRVYDDVLSDSQISDLYGQNVQ
jgi:hypothetical protein